MIPAAKLANADQVATAVAVGRRRGGGGRLPRRRHPRLGRHRPAPPPRPRARHRRGVVPRHPARLDLAAGRAAPPQPRRPRRTRWRDAWGGGLVTTCGLSNVGAASEGHGLHGTYTARAGDATCRSSARRREVTATADASSTRRSRCRAASCTTVGQGLRPHRRSRRQRLRVDGGRAAAVPRQHRRAALGRATPTSRRTPQEVVPRDADAAAGLATWDEPPAVGDGRPGARLRARRRLLGAPHEPSTRRRAHRALVTAAAVAVGRPGERHLRARRSSRRTARCSAASTTSRRAGCRSSTRARPATSWLTIEARSIA